MAEPGIPHKAALRETARAKLRQLTPEQREVDGRRISETLAGLPVWNSAHSVLLFAPRADEPNLWPLVELALREGKLTALPRYIAATATYEAAILSDLTTDVVRGKFGILEPGPFCNVAELKRLDLVLVPGLAFDRHGHRLGRGKGFYDRLLGSVSGKTCGVAFDSQLIPSVPVEPHDVRLNCILTPSHWLEM